VAICKSCGKKYSRWTTPVGARGACSDCFQWELNHEGESKPREDVSLSGTAPASKRNTGIRLSSFIPRSRSKAVFALAMSCYCLTLTYFIIVWANVARVENPPPAFYSIVENPVGEIVVLLLCAPIFESLILVGVLELVRRAHAPAVVQVLAAALIVSVGHFWPWWPHAVIVLPSFCIQAASYLYWRRISWKTAFWVVAWIHCLNNAIPALRLLAVPSERLTRRYSETDGRVGK
jgi:hypothetical protein